ncbi:uncharacterized protein T551_02961 [Pneumocystis jirovecii RU7]|uniref:PIH1 N-terminal domain-containing protein n=1 Tax=Pneumocystis jirovecii (strain RU7) TaxID=1408657 RepID=A0A0W4ZGG9_PNEJ7|nr:uncharacterized protein T551_02961 [Pneumocystis jirovecii RU7]KTW27462.1 hypothetical protein T551_02961 [Pneumocystis jirovecii RU7]
MPFLDIPEKSNRLKSLNIISNNYGKYNEYDAKEKNDHLIVEKIMQGNNKKEGLNISGLSINEGECQKKSKEIYISPLPGFVIKTIQTGDQKKRFPQGTKVFLNLCHSEKVTPPKDGVDRDIGLKIMRGWHWEIPIVVSVERWDVDKAGRKCLVIDCCCNTSVMKLSKEDINIRFFFIETCFEVVEDKTGMILSREYTIPKMKSKGELLSSILELDNIFDKKIQEIDSKNISSKYIKKNASQEIKKTGAIINKNVHLSLSETNIEKNELMKPIYTIEEFFPLDGSTKRFKVVVDLPLIENATHTCLELINKNGVFSLMLCVKDVYAKLKIPISEFYKEENSSIEAFFVNKRKKLYIFVPCT